MPLTVTKGWDKDPYLPNISCSASLFKLHGETLSLFALHCLWVPYAVLYKALSLNFAAVLSTLCKETVCLHSMLARQQSDLLPKSSGGLVLRLDLSAWAEFTVCCDPRWGPLPLRMS